MANLLRVKCTCGNVMNLAPGGFCTKCRQPVNIPGDGLLTLYRMGSPLGIAAGFGIYIDGAPMGHIGNKETLYKIVLERVYQRLNDSEEEIIRCAETADAENAIRSLVHTYFVFLRDNPSYVRMVMWENLNEGRYFDEQNLSDIRNPIKKALHTILTNGQKQGKFIHVPDEKQLLMTLFACPFNYFSNRHTMQRIMDADFSDEQEMNRRIAFITDMLLSYLSK